MATQQQPATETAEEKAEREARKSQTQEAMAALSPEQRAEIILRRQANVMQAQFAGTNWGKGMDADTRKAVADWGNRNFVDVTTEIDILGGNIYLNAKFYIARLVSMVQSGKVLDFRQEFINDDARFQSDIPADVEERNRRRQLRVVHNVPDDATAAVLTTIVLTVMPHTPFYGVKWAPRTQSDPIGKAFPQETALTRSARRCLRLVVRYLPEIATMVQGAEEDAKTSLAEVLEAAHENAKAIGAGPAQDIPIKQVHVAEHIDVEIPADGIKLDLSRTVDPYADTPPAASAPAPAVSDAPVNDLDLFTPEERAEYEQRKRDKGAK